MTEFAKDKVVFKAKLAEQAERYEEMKDFMKEVVLKEKRLNQEERNLLSVAYKNVVGSRRASWRVLDSIARKEKSDGESSYELVVQYRTSVEAELSGICEDVLSLLDGTLLQESGIKDEERVFYFKMKGDYHRYMAEYKEGEEGGKEVISDASFAYAQALESAKSLQATNPIRLGLALNFSVFYYEIMQDQKKACHLAKEAFDNAVSELEDLTEEEYKDATLIMQLLRDNLTLWQSEGDNEESANLEQDGTQIEDC